MDISKKFDLLRFQKSDNREQILEALELVRAFIIAKKRLLAGGMALDMAMRNKGKKLYSDETLPDYDFLSPEHSEDAYLLAEQLCKAGLGPVDANPALHVTTIRVYVFGAVVADITYMPPVLFEKIPSLEHKGVRILHPHYVVMEQCMALSNPFENAPREVVLQRFGKDVERLQKIVELYPFAQTLKPVLKKHAMHVPESVTQEGLGMLNGWAALAWYNSLSADKTALEGKYMTGWTVAKVHSPSPITVIMSESWSATVNSIGSKDKREFHHATAGYPRYVRVGSLEIYDTLGKKLTVVTSGSLRIASLTNILWYFLHLRLYYGDPLAELGILNCWHLMTKETKWHLNTDTYGNWAWNESFAFYVKRRSNQAEGRLRPASYRFSTEEGCENSKARFNPLESPYFTVDGGVSEEFTAEFPLDVLKIRDG